MDVFPVTRYTEKKRVDAQKLKLGYELGDVSAVIIGHLHLDCAGGLEFFPVWIRQFISTAKSWCGPDMPVAAKENLGGYERFAGKGIVD